MRLFIALDIEEAIRRRIADFIGEMRGLAPDARWLRPESVHITLKFIGERSEDEAVKIQQALEAIKAAKFDVDIRGFGFFPNPEAPRVFWIGVEAGPALTSLASNVDASLVPLGIAKEGHEYNPHLTLARGGKGSGSPRKQKGDVPNQSFQRLREKLANYPQSEFGTMTASDFFLYQSKLGPGGSKYTKLARFILQ
jgi:RNA 2',3'-cyclic 3'-phosphodiesterase